MPSRRRSGATALAPSLAGSATSTPRTLSFDFAASRLRSGRGELSIRNRSKGYLPSSGAQGEARSRRMWRVRRATRPSLLHPDLLVDEFEGERRLPVHVRRIDALPRHHREEIVPALL